MYNCKERAMTVLDLSGMRAYLDGGIEEEREIIAVFVSKAEQDLNAIAAACAAQDEHEWREACHSLKGSAALLGAEILREACFKGEKTQDVAPETLESIKNEINAAHKDVVQALREEGLC
ncbi:MAG: hypothetical protein CL561_00710 [Alphaproteobacteria bacterium]|nr:hypothetical protein [Alphaproteobacteria bacterium]|tara:strand:+ start:792 stop:1151 length:360 start_codon:yes stop_codon:yes gene_type:complete